MQPRRLFKLMLTRFSSRILRSITFGVRGRLVVGLLPGLLALLILLGIGLYATDILVAANKHLGDAGWELATTRALQLKLQQVLFPFENDAPPPASKEAYESFLLQASAVDALILQAQTQYGERAEQASFQKALVSWQATRELAKRLLDPKGAPLTSSQRQDLQAGLVRAGASAQENLEKLNIAVLDEMQKTVTAGQRAHDQATLLLVGSVLIAFLSGILFLIFFTNYITRPLATLAADARRLGSGDLDVRSAIDSSDEFGLLALEFNQMAQRLQSRTAELEAASAERAAYASELQQVLNRYMQVQETERRRIALDIHDSVSQWLMGALFELQAARVRLAAESEPSGHIREAQRILKEAKEELRRVIYDLHPPLLESNGLVPALRGLIQEQQQHCKITLHFDVMGQPLRLPPQQALAFYRITQEALTNIQKHAQVDEAWILLAFSPENVSLLIRDEGPGFVTTGGHRPKQLGLTSMRERAMAVGARIDIRTAPGAGVAVQVVVPAPGPGKTFVTEENA